MTNETKYNGYTNYETWNCALWLDNEPYTQSQMSEKADELCGDLANPFDEMEIADAKAEMATFIESLVDELYEMEPAPKGMFGDMLSAALREIDYHDIADSQLADTLREAQQAHKAEQEVV